MATAAPQDPIQPKPDSKPADTLLSEKTAALDISAPTSEAPSSTETSSIQTPKDQPPADGAEKIEPPAATSAAAAVPASTEIAEPSPAHTGPVLVPFASPLPSCKPQVPADLTAEQSKKYDELLALAKGWTEVPQTASRNAPKDAVTDDDRLWLTRECLLRYLRASRWDVAAAAKRAMATLTWRREYGLATFTAEYVSPENETGKQVVMGYDNEARPCLYLNPSKQNTARTERQIHHLVFMLERVIDLMGPGQETLALLINFADTRSGQGASVGQGKQVMNILQSHYPERLGRALISELPWYIKTFFSFISPFIDPVTKSKMIFNDALSNHVPAEQLLIHFGGKLEFEYQHETYWPALNSLCEQRRDEYRARWIEAGKHIGEHEGYLRGGDTKPLNAQSEGSDVKEEPVESS